MFKMTCKKWTFIFGTVEEFCWFLERMGTTLFEDGSYVKICYLEDFKK